MWDVDYIQIPSRTLKNSNNNKYKKMISLNLSNKYIQNSILRKVHKF